MKALTWQGPQNVKVTEVAEPTLIDPTDAIVRVTSTAICGSDLHLYGVLAPFLTRGDVLGHEFMGVVEQIGSGVGSLAVGDRVVVPFNISCGHCHMCDRGLFAQCETTQNVDQGKGASLFGYTSMYGAVPGGQAEYVRVPHADFGPIRITSDLPDERFLFLSDILPTAWQGVQYADVPEGGSLAVVGLGPVGQMAVRSAKQLGIENVIGVDLVPERLELARRFGADVIDLRAVKDVADEIRQRTDGRGADGVLEAVGMEAHGAPVAGVAAKVAARLPGALGRAAMENVAVDKLAALNTCFESVRRGGTVSISGVYGGAVDPIPLMDIFDKGITLRMGQCHVKRWTDELYELVSTGDDTLGLESFTTHHLPLADAEEAYAMFAEKSDGCIKVVLKP